MHDIFFFKQFEPFRYIPDSAETAKFVTWVFRLAKGGKRPLLNLMFFFARNGIICKAACLLLTGIMDGSTISTMILGHMLFIIFSLKFLTTIL
jgi:hypothetical protein